MSKYRIDADFMALKIGTCTGGDADMEYISFYGFEPVDGVPMPKASCLSIADGSGKWQCFDDDGNITAEGSVSPVFSANDRPNTD